MSKRPARIRRTQRALVLHRAPFGESSLVVRVLTAEEGAVRLLAKGAHRAKSAFAWTLDLFDELELRFATTAGEGLGTLEAGTVMKRRRNIPTRLPHYEAALCGLELTDVVARPGQHEPGLFEALTELIEALDHTEVTAPPEAHLARFEGELLELLGLAPALLHCASCGAPPTRGAEQRAPFSAGAGGRLCVPCAHEARKGGRRVGTLSIEALEALHATVGGQLPTSPALASQAHEIAARFLDFHLDSRPRTHERFHAPLRT